MSGISYLLLKLLPKNIFSRLVGKLADYPLPSPLLQSLIQAYVFLYKIDTKDIKKPLVQMKTFGEFFTRELKAETRPISQEENAVVSPVDGKIGELGKVDQGLLLQAKGIYYSLTDLIGEKEATLFSDGYFVTIYLSPADYHRIHTPCDGKINEFSYFSGNLWPVNQWGVKNIGSLFCVNERILTPIENRSGRVGIVKVGATVVGKISLQYSNLTSNSGNQTQLSLPVHPSREVTRGDEMGKFHIGSTVILIFEKDSFTPFNLYHEKKLKMGEKIGLLSAKAKG